MKLGQIKKITFSTLRVGYSYGGAFECEEQVTRNCRLVLDKYKRLKWQIVKKNGQKDWDYFLSVDQECLDNTEHEDLIFNG